VSRPQCSPVCTPTFFCEVCQADAYGAPQAPVQEEYGAPVAPALPTYQG